MQVTTSLKKYQSVKFQLDHSSYLKHLNHSCKSDFYLPPLNHILCLITGCTQQSRLPDTAQSRQLRMNSKNLTKMARFLEFISSTDRYSSVLQPILLQCLQCHLYGPYCTSLSLHYWLSCIRI